MHYRKKDKDLSTITQCVLAFKGLMKWEQGLQSVMGETNAMDALAKSLEFVSSHMRVHILQVLAVLCIVDIEAHKYAKKKKTKILSENLSVFDENLF